MLETLSNVLESALQQLRFQITTYLPPFLAALTLVLAAWLLALCARWVVNRIFKGRAIDKFLRQSGIAFLVDPSGRLRATRLVSGVVYWGLLLGGFLLGIDVFNTQLSTRMVQGFVLLLPKLLVAGFILLGGTWLGQYLGRNMLVWAVNENFPTPRRLAVVVRILVIFVAVVVAADQLDFARNVFLAAFIILVGGAMLAASLAIGLGHTNWRRLVEERKPKEPAEERSIWSHL